MADILAAFPASPLFYAVGLATVFATALSKGAFGGGLPIVVPLLAIVVDPMAATIVSAPLLVFMDVFTVRAFGRATWSLPDLAALLPGMFVGLAIGWALFAFVDPAIVALAIALVTLAFAGHWFAMRGRPRPAAERASPSLGVIAGVTAGFTTFIAHAGGPPVMMYLLRRGLGKSVFAGTMAMFFLIANVVKLPPFFLLMAERPETIGMAAALAPVVPAGVWLGKRMHDRLDQAQLYFWAHALLVAAGLKMLADAIAAFLQ
jgi:hypothetical protein